ncbi:LOW QUALITY PROTEIN: coagulation factor XIII B chain-like [Bombina bombina]|uniref:LOW QUALITY PROTEIN: coagulation factor XIII B chain-like n=1 Tax=Bombina bombina TaxID=8345 RepID=UPI00235ADF64|nr:LOW QUALITY PROTEIN: coagulation factor XIII B chain-like [Bombina bombina]
MITYTLWILLGVFMICSGEEGCSLPNVENGKIAQYFYIFKKFYFPMEEGKKMTVSCTAGYTSLSGKQEEQITCSAGEWLPAAVCFKKCNKPSLENGVIQNLKDSYKVLENIQYVCYEGYTAQSGNKTEQTVCSSSGWDPQPGCHKVSDRCEVPFLDNGQYLSAERVFQVNQRLQYECEKGHYTTGGGRKESVECLPHGWSYVPRCTKGNNYEDWRERVMTYDASMRTDLVQSWNLWIMVGFHPIKGELYDRDVVQFFCREGFSLHGSELIQCYSFGWYPEPQLVKKDKCPPPPRPAHTIPHSQDRTEHRAGVSVRYECDHNYMLLGPEEILCEEGYWTAPPKLCGFPNVNQKLLLWKKKLRLTQTQLKQKWKCDQPPATQNGEAVIESELYHSGDRVLYRCAEGYGIEGSNEIICKLGKWPEPPKCKAKTEFCSTPPEVKNGELIDAPLASYRGGSSVEYRCQSYYLMEGPKAVTCTGGAWSELPTCLEPCTVTSDHMRSRNLKFKWSFEMNSIFLHGDLVEFMCSDGYDMSEHSELKGRCDRGQILYPTCSKTEALKGCGPPPVVRNARISSTQDFHMIGSTVAYQCKDYHFLNGTSVVRCSDGEWEMPPTCIEPCVLSQEEMNRNHIVLKWRVESNYFFHGEFIDFICKDGFQNIQPTMLFAIRAQCSNGQLKYPTCVQRK